VYPRSKRSINRTVSMPLFLFVEATAVSCGFSKKLAWSHACPSGQFNKRRDNEDKSRVCDDEHEANAPRTHRSILPDLIGVRSIKLCMNERPGASFQRVLISLGIA